MATETKKPRWTALNFNQIERRRKDLGMSKSAMATALGITNSTYHNWQRGTTVPHYAQQETLKAALDGLNAAPVAAPAKARRRLPERSGGMGEHVAGGPMPMQGGFQMTHPFFPPSGHSVPGSNIDGIATITSAFIKQQAGGVSAGSVISFVSELQKALNPGTPDVQHEKAEKAEASKVTTDEAEAEDEDAAE